MGQLYQRGRMWWVKYYVDKQPRRESTGIASDPGTTAPAEAKRFLKVREGRAAAGLPMLPRADRVRYEEIAADLPQYYETGKTRDLTEAGFRLAHLDAFFAGRRV